MTHKLGTWHDQFGTSGCVGCGRCITWCPVGIDITEEVAAIRATGGRRWCDSLRRSLADVPFLEGMGPDRLALLAGCASNVHFDAGQVVFREGDQADAFYIVRHGTVARRGPCARRGAP